MKKISLFLCLTMVITMFSIIPGAASEPADVTSGAAAELVMYDWENEGVEVGTNISETYIYRNTDDPINTEYDKLVLVENPLKTGINTSSKAAMIEISDNADLATATLKLQFGFTDTVAEGETLVTKFKVYRPSTAPENGDELYLTQFGSIVNASRGVTSSSGNRLGSVVLKQVSGGNQLRLGSSSDNLAKIFDENWHEMVSVFDMTTKTVTVFMDGEMKGTTNWSDSITTDNTEKFFEFNVNAQHQPDSSNRTWPDPGTGKQHIYLDDIAAYRVKSATVTSPVQEATDVDPAEAIKLNFTVPVTDADTLKNAISVNNNATVQLVTLAADGMSADVLLGDVQYNNTAYTLTINKDTFKDCYLRGLAADATVSFTSQTNAPAENPVTELKKYDWESVVIGTELAGATGTSAVDNQIYMAKVVSGDKLNVADNPSKSGINTSDNVLRFEISDDANVANGTTHIRLGFNDTMATGETLITKVKVYRTNEDTNELYLSLFDTLANAGYNSSVTDNERLSKMTLNRNASGNMIDGNNKAIVSDGNWHEIVSVFNMAKKTAVIMMDGVQIATKTFPSAYETESAAKCIEFAVYAVRTDSSGNNKTYPTPGVGTQYLYLDDIAAYRVKSATVTSPVQGATDVDPAEAIKLNFTVPVTDADALKNAISVNNDATVQLVTIADDGMSADVLLGDVQYNNTAYTLTINKDTFKDCYLRGLAADATVSFTSQANAPMPTATTELETYDWENETVGTEVTAFNADTKYADDKITVQANPLSDSVNSSDNVLRFELSDAEAAGTKSLKLYLGFTDTNAEDETLITKYKIYRGASQDPKGLYFTELGSVINASATAGGSSANRIVSTQMTRNNDGQKINYATNISDEAWHEVVTVLDFKAGTSEVIVDGESIATTELGAITEKETKAVEFAAYAVRRASDGYPTVGSGTQYLYIDDVEAYRVKTTSIMAEITEGQTEVDPTAPIKLNFNLPVTDSAALKNAISIVNTATSEEVAAERITVTIANDGLSANIIVAGGLEYLKTPYTLTVDKDAFPDMYKRKLAADYTLSFTTKAASGINIVDNVTSAWDGAKLTATVTVVNPTETAGPAWVVLASFTDENYMTAVDFAEVSEVSANGESEPITLVLDDVGDATQYRVFLWDDAESLTPYHMPVEISK